MTGIVFIRRSDINKLNIFSGYGLREGVRTKIFNFLLAVPLLQLNRVKVSSIEKTMLKKCLILSLLVAYKITRPLQDTTVQIVGFFET